MKKIYCILRGVNISGKNRVSVAELKKVFEKYKLSFDILGLLLFLIIMIPNFIWFSVPAPNDVLRADSVTEVVDTIASICQVLMVIALCIFVNRRSGKFR